MIRISKALRDFASEKGWKPEQYQIFFRSLEQWGRISVFLVAESFSGLTTKDMWDEAFDYLEKSLKQYGDIGFSVGLTVREKNQIEAGGIYSIPIGFVNEEEFLLRPTVVD